MVKNPKDKRNPKGKGWHNDHYEHKLVGMGYSPRAKGKYLNEDNVESDIDYYIPDSIKDLYDDMELGEERPIVFETALITDVEHFEVPRGQDRYKLSVKMSVNEDYELDVYVKEHKVEMLMRELEGQPSGYEWTMKEGPQEIPNLGEYEEISKISEHIPTILTSRDYEIQGMAKMSDNGIEVKLFDLIPKKYKK